MEEVVKQLEVGDPLEMAAIKAIEWSYKSDEKAMLKKGGDSIVQIVQRHHFASHLKRMAVVHTEGQFYTFVKVAPETIQERLNDIPAFYVSTYKKYTRQGSCVLALAYKPLPDMMVSEARNMDRVLVESGLTFASFACIEKVDIRASMRIISASERTRVQCSAWAFLISKAVAEELCSNELFAKEDCLSGPLIKTYGDYRFYSIPAEYREFRNKDKTLVFQFSVKHDQQFDYGGGYIVRVSFINQLLILKCRCQEATIVNSQTLEEVARLEKMVVKKR
ncbi:manganese-transporting ATPase [Artemisia annua]|uniref:Manganese-transporting ATPase n=1 Tax=Artemisia annua TaxID=35608 RepID=A0A2U1MSD6_ARTAN|nr:manganese-transporting ATPase [Artemisia annua]